MNSSVKAPPQLRPVAGGEILIRIGYIACDRGIFTGEAATDQLVRRQHTPENCDCQLLLWQSSIYWPQSFRDNTSPAHLIELGTYCAPA
jgi:hypothetical protein